MNETAPARRVALRSLAVAAALAVGVPALADPAASFDRTLTATIVAPDGETAILSDASGGTRTVHPGDLVDGWRVKTIQPKEIVMIRPAAEDTAAETVTLRIRNAIAAEGPPPPTAEEKLHQGAVLSHQDRDPEALRRE